MTLYPDEKIAIGFHSDNHSAPARQTTTVFNETGENWFSPLLSILTDCSPCKSLPGHALLSHSVLFLYPASQYPAKWYLFEILERTNLAQKLEQRASPWLLQLGGISPLQSPRSTRSRSFKLQNKVNSSCSARSDRLINAAGSGKQKCCTKESTVEGTSSFSACIKTDLLVADVNPRCSISAWGLEYDKYYL